MMVKVQICVFFPLYCFKQTYLKIFFSFLLIAESFCYLLLWLAFKHVLLLAL